MKINLQILDKNTQKFVYEKSVDIPFIPRKEEKLFHQDKKANVSATKGLLRSLLIG